MRPPVPNLARSPLPLQEYHKILIAALPRLLRALISLQAFPLSPSPSMEDISTTITAVITNSDDGSTEDGFTEPFPKDDRS